MAEEAGDDVSWVEKMGEGEDGGEGEESDGRWTGEEDGVCPGVLAMDSRVRFGP